MQQSIWFSAAPLIIFNIIVISSAVCFRWIYRKREKTKDIEERHSSTILNKWIREYWFWLTDPFVKFFIRFGFSPNRLTFLGAVISFISAYFFATGNFGLGGWIMILAATFDTFDGRVARATNNETISGAYFDAVMDRVAEGAVFLGLGIYYRDSVIVLSIVFLALAGSFLVSYARAKGESTGVQYSGGFMQRPERLAYLGAGAVIVPMISVVLVKVSPYLAFDNLYLLPLSFVAIGSWMTAVIRIKNVMALLDQKN